jgi:hypothetical protein
MESQKEPQEGLDRRTVLGIIGGGAALVAGTIGVCKAMDIPNNTMAEDVLDKEDIRENKIVQRILQQ